MNDWRVTNHNSKNIEATEVKMPPQKFEKLCLTTCRRMIYRRHYRANTSFAAAYLCMERGLGMYVAVCRFLWLGSISFYIYICTKETSTVVPHIKWPWQSWHARPITTATEHPSTGRRVNLIIRRVCCAQQAYFLIHSKSSKKKGRKNERWNHSKIAFESHDEPRGAAAASATDYDHGPTPVYHGW